MYNQQPNFDGYQVPPGMVLVAAPQEQAYPRVIESSHQQQSYPRMIEPSYQQQSYPRTIEPSQTQQPRPTMSQYAPSAHQVQPVNHTLQNSCMR